MNTTVKHHPNRRQAIGVALLVPLVVVTAAACSSSSASGPAPSGSPSGRNRDFPGANGLIAAVTASSIQVQGNNRQTEVDYGAGTKITSTKLVSLKAVKVGDCVNVTGAPGSAASTISATMVRISAATNGDCTREGPGGGDRPSGAPGGPGGGPGGAPGGGGPGGGNSGGPYTAFAIASGKVTSIAGTTIVVNGQSITRAPSASPAMATGNTTVTVPGTAHVTQQVAATAAALVVGQCAAAIGKPNESGAIAATTISVSEPENGSCVRGFGRRFGGGPGGSQGSGNNGGGNA